MMVCDTQSRMGQFELSRLEAQQETLGRIGTTIFGQVAAFGA